jgi:hypothetical protein
MDTARLFKGKSDEIQTLTSAFALLESADTGKAIANQIQDNGTIIQFGPLENDAIAQFDPQSNRITVNETQKELGSAALAAHLAHEDTHVKFKDKPNSIEEEYQAFRSQALVWDDLKQNETDEQCDTVSAIIALGEDRAKAIIRQAYRHLLEK